MVKEHKCPVDQDKTLTNKSKDKGMVLFNDDVNTFDFVINCLIDICEHDQIQAEQCALITHYKGKCTIMSGNFDSMYPKASELLERGLSVEII